MIPSLASPWGPDSCSPLSLTHLISSPDINSDGVLDEQELEALFTKELEKVYDPKNEEDDMREMEEERLRMREHVMKNVREAMLGMGSGQQAQHSH